MNNDYIRRDAVLAYPIRLNHYDRENGNVHFVYGVENVMEYVESLPAAFVAPVVHGRWEEYQVPRIICCSECDWGTGVENKTEYNYCPNCGAKMDGE